MAPNLTVEKLLPVEAIGEEKGSKEKPDSGRLRKLRLDYIYEQPEAELLNKLLPRYIETQYFARHAGIIGFGIRRG